MTKEEFRRKLMEEKYGGKPSDMMVTACLRVQIELGEVDAQKILDMPSTRFDLLIQEIVEKTKSKGGNKTMEQTLGGI